MRHQKSEQIGTLKSIGRVTGTILGTGAKHLEPG